MVLKALMNRPSTSSSNKRHSTIGSSHGSPTPASPSAASIDSTSTRRPSHRKIGSLQRLSLSFTPLRDGSTFQSFLTDEPEQMRSRQNSEAARTTSPTPAPAPIPHSRSTPTPLSPALEQEQEYQYEEDDDPTPRPQRFSLMKFKHASEPQLSSRYKESQSSHDEPLPPPTIITTAPTTQVDPDASPSKQKEKFLSRTFSTFRRSQVVRQDLVPQSKLLQAVREPRNTGSSPELRRYHSDIPLPTHDGSLTSPPAYGDESGSALAIPIDRLSDSSQGSRASEDSHQLYAKTTTTHVISTTTTFFKMKRNKEKAEEKERAKSKKKRDKGLLFPLPEHLPQANQSTSGRTSFSNTNPPSTGRKSMSPSRKSTQNIRWNDNISSKHTPAESPTASSIALGSPGPPVPTLVRNQSSLSIHSGASTPSTTLVPPRLGARGRSSTMGSLGKSSDRNDHLPSGRTSTSTVGRRSFGDILSLSQRLRQNSAPPRHGSIHSGSTPGSKSNSFQIARDAEAELVYPQREEEDTPASYLEKLEAAVPRGAMATILCKHADEFSKTCLRKYMRGFSYFGESIDMAIRKMLMEVILPKETQQIDRLLQGFADRYHECNPGIFINADEANFVSFSILLLQSDNHNKNNKHKMTKMDYVKNTQNGRISVADDILECFYDNICYTPFIHLEDDVAVNSHRLTTPKPRKTLMRSKSTDNLKGPIDPYALILDNKLDMLRPPLKDALETDDPYSTPSISSSDQTAINFKAFVHAAVLQIISKRSRPDAFMTQAGIDNTDVAQAGLVSIKIAKVGLLWRKSIKKKKAKSPWQEWGAVLTDSKLYFFKDVSWVKKLINQQESHAKVTTRHAPLVFKPPVESFTPDALMAMDDAVALIDTSYKKHKHAFTFIKHGGFEEVFLANSDGDASDWVSKLNYASTFRTANVRMRGLLGTVYEGKHLLRNDSTASTTTTETSDAQGQGGKTNQQAAWEIMFYRRQLVSEKISTFDDHVAAAQKELDYLLRNARHLVVLLPIQQKTREALVSAAGRMNAKLKWTRKEIWRARIHRDVLIKDLEAEATSAFPAPVSMKSPLNGTPVKTTPTKAQPNALLRTDTDKTTASKATTVISPGSTRRPSQAILDQITPDESNEPEIEPARRQSVVSINSKKGSEVDRASIHSKYTQDSPLQHKNSSNILVDADQTPSELDIDESVPDTDVVPDADGAADARRGSDSSRDRQGSRHRLPHPHLIASDAIKDRAGSVKRSLHRTLRDSSNHIHIPTHNRSKKGKESGSSIAGTDEGRHSIASGDFDSQQELKRDPTGKFVLHGKKASVITMGPEWSSFTVEERKKMFEQMLNPDNKIDGEDSESLATKRSSLRIDTGVNGNSPRSAERSTSGNGNARDSTNFSIYSAVTSAPRESFHSAQSGRTRRGSASSL